MRRRSFVDLKKKKITNECVVRHATRNAINDRLFTFKLYIHRTQHRAAASTSSSQYRSPFSFTGNEKKGKKSIYFLNYLYNEIRSYMHL